MAKITIGDYINFSTPNGHTATDWQVALDSKFKIIIDESICDEINLKEWHTPLPKVMEKGFYSDLDIIYARVRIRFDNVVSNWLELNDNQNYQKVIITENGEIIEETTSDIIGMQ